MFFNRKDNSVFNNGDTSGKPSFQNEAKNCDTCVLCGAKTIYDVSTPITERSFYISGGGQLCQNCFKKLNFF